jgi:hypothetical protein
MQDIVRFIPLDKSWIIRMGVLDLIHHKKDTIVFLQQQRDLPQDLKSLLQASLDWEADRMVYVGESGTLYRFLLFSTWMANKPRVFVCDGTLRERAISLDPSIVTYPIAKLLELDNGTSQWASAAVLWRGGEEKVKNPPYKLRLTYEAKEHWEECQRKGVAWEPRLDITIHTQARAFCGMWKSSHMQFSPQQAEDYCFARAFGCITPEEGLNRWPALVGHESNRIEAMEKSILQFENHEWITSSDHRVIQAMGMLAVTHRRGLQIANYQCVEKSWPLFWEFVYAVVKN